MRNILTVGLPATPRFRQMLQNGLRLVLLDRLGHHVEDVVHHGSTQLKIIVRLHTLLRNGLRDTLAVTSFELTGKQVSKPRVPTSDHVKVRESSKCLPSLKKRHDTTHEEQPDPPARCPETNTRSLADRTSIEAVVDEMLEVLGHTNLPHELSPNVSATL